MHWAVVGRTYVMCTFGKLGCRLDAEGPCHFIDLCFLVDDEASSFDITVEAHAHVEDEWRHREGVQLL